MQKKTNRGQAALIADRHSTTLPASWRAWRLLLQRFVCFWTALAALSHIHAFSLNDIELWAGTGTNRAALVIHWSAPEVRNNSVLESPIANHSLAWGYRWNGAAVAEDMVKAIALADARLTPVVSPPSAFGLSLLGFILDVNGNGIAGLRNGTNVLLPSPTNGFISINYGSADVFQSLDAGDLYWGGWNGATWELWHGRNAASGGTNAPDRGFHRYWTRTNGTHGEWRLMSVGMGSLGLTNGSWVGWSVAAGGLNFIDPQDPGTIAFRAHKRAPKNPLPARAPLSPYATHIVAAQAPFGVTPYDDVNAVIGIPATDFYDPFGIFSGGDNLRFVKLVEPPFNFSTNQETKLITTLSSGASNSYIIAGFAEAIHDDPAHPYGIDFLVFGNSFYASSGATHDQANMNTLMIGGGGFFEPLKVSVSPGFTGLPGETIDDASTWPWYRYDNGPFADAAFPTHAYHWNRAHTNWSMERMDFTKPVNPALTNLIHSGGAPVSAADAIEYYAGAGGGTGFDLSESGFATVRYVKVEGIGPDFTDGEIDAIARVRPATLNDTLSVFPANLTSGGATFRFQRPGEFSELAAMITFQSLQGPARLRASTFNNPEERTGLPAGILQVTRVDVWSALGTNAVAFQASVTLAADGAYAGTGSDLSLLRRAGTNWVTQSFGYDAGERALVVTNVTHGTTFALVQTPAVPLHMASGTNGFIFRYEAVPGWIHTLEWTSDFVQWQAGTPFHATERATVEVAAEPASFGNAFYRLRLELP